MHYREILRERKRLDRIKRMYKKCKPRFEPPQPLVQYVKEQTVQRCKPTRYINKSFRHNIGYRYIHPNGLMYADMYQQNNFEGVNYQYCDIGKCYSEREMRIKSKRRKAIVCDEKFVWYESNYVYYHGNPYWVPATELDYTYKNVKMKRMKKTKRL